MSFLKTIVVSNDTQFANLTLKALIKSVIVILDMDQNWQIFQHFLDFL